MIGLLFSFFKVIVIFLYYFNISEIYLELSFITNLKDLLTFYLNVLEIIRFISLNLFLKSKKELDINKLFILIFRYYKNKNYLSFFNFFF